MGDLFSKTKQNKVPEGKDRGTRAFTRELFRVAEAASKGTNTRAAGVPLREQLTSRDIPSSAGALASARANQI